MIIQQVRNATIIVEYGGKKILFDPMLGKKGSMPPFPLVEINTCATLIPEDGETVEYL